MIPKVVSPDQLIGAPWRYVRDATSLALANQSVSPGQSPSDLRFNKVPGDSDSYWDFQNADHTV